jgi:ATPase subunit of ABC transporter with duplicated ATPase domains
VGSRSTAKLQAAKARAPFAEKEAELERQRAEIEEQEAISAAAAASRKRANQQTELKKELAHMESEYKDINGSDITSEPGVPVVDPQIKTAEFVQNSLNKYSFNHNAENFIPNNARTDEVSDFTKFLLRKDILTSGLSVFSDKPETYQSWKSN